MRSQAFATKMLAAPQKKVMVMDTSQSAIMHHKKKCVSRISSCAPNAEHGMREEDGGESCPRLAHVGAHMSHMSELLELWSLSLDAGGWLLLRLVWPGLVWPPQTPCPVALATALLPFALLHLRQRSFCDLHFFWLFSVLHCTRKPFRFSSSSSSSSFCRLGRVPALPSPLPLLAIALPLSLVHDTLVLAPARQPHANFILQD